MARAFEAMVSGRPGPVAVEMPLDMFPAVADVTPVEPLGKRAAPVPDADKIAALAKLVNAARAPMIWVGGGANEAGPEVLALAEKIGAPVVAFRTGKGVVDSRHPLSLTTVAGFKIYDQYRPADRHRHAARRAGGALGAGAGGAEDGAHRHRPGGASPADGQRADRRRCRRGHAGADRRWSSATTGPTGARPWPRRRRRRWRRSRRRSRSGRWSRRSARCCRTTASSSTR